MNRPLDALKEFMAGSGGEDSFELRPGVVVVGSGKGGVGTSVIAALLALQAVRRGEKVLLVDADESVGSLHLMFGVSDPGPGLGALRKSGVTPDSLLLEVAPGLSLFPGGGGGVDATLALAAGERRVLLRRVSGLYENFGVVIVDGGSRLDSVMAACFVGSERLLCVTTPGRISLAANYALFKLARSRFRGLPIELLVNLSGDGRPVYEIVKAATASFLGMDVSFGGTVPSDDMLRECLETGTSLSSLGTTAPAVAAAGAVVDRILAAQRAPTGGAGIRSLLPHL